MSQGFDGLMLDSVWNGIQLKKRKNIKDMPLHVVRADGSGVEKVVFQEIQEFNFPNEYALMGTCKIQDQTHTFEYYAPFGRQNASLIGFLPQ